MSSVHHHSHHRDVPPRLKLSPDREGWTYSLAVFVGQESVQVSGIDPAELAALRDAIGMALDAPDAGIDPTDEDLDSEARERFEAGRRWP